MAKKRKMKTHKWSDLKKAHPLTPEARHRVGEAILRDAIVITLQGLREMAGKTQQEVARSLDKTQSELSKMERRSDVLLSSLREYVEALGGHLELRAVFDDRSLIINPLLTDEQAA